MGINRYKERHATSVRIKNRDVVEEQMEEVERVEGEQVESEDVLEKGKKHYLSIIAIFYAATIFEVLIN